MQTALGLWRVARVLLHVLLGAWICGAVFPFLTPDGRRLRVRWWSVRTLRVLGVALESTGTPPDGAMLVVANHVSWLDILAIDAVHACRFVSKADVRRWPLIGWLVACGGTLFIERDRKRDALRVVHQVAEALQNGQTMAVFPEGTTSDGSGVLPFHANLLQAAIAAGTSVQPVALRYSDDRHACSRAAPYVGDVDLARSLWSIVTAPGLCVRVDWLQPVPTAHTERRVLSEALRERILAALDANECRGGG